MLVAAVACILFFSGPMLVCFLLAHPIARQKTDPAFIEFNAVVSIIGMALGVFLFFLSGPRELRLDADRRLYHLTRGWPFFPQTKIGSWEEIYGVYAGCTQNGEYIVGVTWRSRGGSMEMKRFSRSPAAEQFAKEVISFLGVSQVIPPRHLHHLRLEP